LDLGFAILDSRLERRANESCTCEPAQSPRRSSIRSIANRKSKIQNRLGRARRGGSGALNLQSAIAGSIALPRFWLLSAFGRQVVLKIGSHAIERCESGQVLTEAAISKCPYVPWERLVGANYLSNTVGAVSKKGARPFFLNERTGE